MTDAGAASVHASAVKVGDRAVLIRGPSGAGKSRLAFDLIIAGRSGQIPPSVLVGDDRVYLDAGDGRLLVRPARELAGLIEIYGLGIRRCDFADQAMVASPSALSAPVRFSAQMRPPWASMICFEIDSPRPEFCPTP